MKCYRKMANFLWLLVFALSCFTGCRAIGTTQNLQEIFIGRCWEYQRVINPDSFQNGEKNCTDLWLKFRDAFIYKHPCDVTPEDYRPFTEAAAHSIEPNKHLFWESVYPFVNDYSAKGQRYTTVADTLLGFMADKIMWCGQEGDPGVNYDDCPLFTDCTEGYTPEYAYWIMTSLIYSDLAVGTVYVMMNGSFPLPFDPNSIFANYELINLTPEKNVTRMEILVVHNLGGPIVESCGEGSILNLEVQAQSQGLDTSCVNNPDSIRHFQCVDNPEASECSNIDLSVIRGGSHITRGCWGVTVFICSVSLLFLVW